MTRHPTTSSESQDGCTPDLNGARPGGRAYILPLRRSLNSYRKLESFVQEDDYNFHKGDSLVLARFLQK
jgi:hypothetical protein